MARAPGAAGRLDVSRLSILVSSANLVAGESAMEAAESQVMAE